MTGFPFNSSRLSRRVVVGAAGALAACTFAVTPTLARATSPASPHLVTNGQVLSIETLSNRADLVSGGDALVRINLPTRATPQSLRVRLRGRDVTRAFAVRSDGRVEGLLTGLVNGTNLVTATLADGRGARLTITNHPRGGPVLSGPQIQPWLCTTQENGLGPALDNACNAPTKVSYVYQPTGSQPGDYKSYDPSQPPSDVATTTTDQGRRVPYIVRVEEGTLDRSIYKVEVLADPTRPWTAVDPQAVWNRKLFVAFGGGCGTIHMQTPPTQAGLSFPFGPVEYLFGDSAADGELQQPELLARGWMVTGGGLTTLNQNCNEVVSAELLMMLKEHIIDSYGSVLRTISVGGSGGSLQQYNIAASYPGLLDGIVPTQSFPDLWNMTGDTADCYLLDHYFTTVSPQLWTGTDQQLAVEGKSGPLSCSEFVAALADWFDPQARGVFHAGAGVRFNCELPPNETYRPLVNPTGARCSVQDYQGNIWGRSGADHAAPLPWDNTGVQYGLLALKRHLITPAQFVDLNTHVGGIDNEGDLTTGRARMSQATATTMYRAGRTTDAHGLATVPIIDIRAVVNASDPEKYSDMHQPFYTAVTRARLVAANGTAGNLVTWSVVPTDMDVAGALAIDRWLQAVAADHSNASLQQKIVRDKPRDLVSTCWINSQPVTDQATCTKQYPGPSNGGDARIGAGSPLTDDVRTCQLTPLRAADYPVTFTPQEWAALEQAFPAGVCDWSRPGVGTQRAQTWMSYATGPGGRPLGRRPTSTAIG
jgi:hypothetical protein